MKVQYKHYIKQQDKESLVEIRTGEIIAFIPPTQETFSKFVVCDSVTNKFEEVIIYDCIRINKTKNYYDRITG